MIADDTINPQEMHKEFFQIEREFSETEKHLKCIERSRIQEGLDIESVCSLSDASWALLKALRNNTDIKQLHSAISFIRKAEYEILALGIIQQIDVIDRFQDDFKNEPISPHLPEWFDIQKKADEIAAWLKRNISGVSIDIILPEANHYYTELKKISIKIDSCREELLKSSHENSFTTKNQFIGWIIAIVTLFLKMLSGRTPH